MDNQPQLQAHGYRDFLVRKYMMNGYIYHFRMDYYIESSSFDRLLKILGKKNFKIEFKSSRRFRELTMSHNKGLIDTSYDSDDNQFVIELVTNDEVWGQTLWETIHDKISPIVINENEISVKFWRMTSMGTQTNTRNIQCPNWQDLTMNYAMSTRDGLDGLMKLDKDMLSINSGKLILWHGEPGTGKTYALRAWAKACQSLIDVHYILDPDLFFGNAAYMFEVMMAQNDNNRWKLIVAEDTGELLAKDAKMWVGQSLSKLLNVCDGLVGQGLQSLFLITTNEELGTLHPAVIRPGRCFANIGFNKLNRQEVSEWLQKHGVKCSQEKEATVAELYSKINNGQIVVNKERTSSFGFAPVQKETKFMRED